MDHLNSTTLFMRIHVLSFIKASAIILVLAFHFFGELSGWHIHVVSADWFFAYWKNFTLASILHFAEAYFYLGVNLFVIASGCGLSWSYLHNGKSLRWKTFLQKRFRKLLAPALASVVLLFFFKGLLLGGWPTQTWWLNFFPLGAGLNLFSDQWFYPPINGEMWFLGLILQLYLLFPYLTRGLEKWGTLKFLAVLLGITVIFRTLYFFWLQKYAVSLSYGFFLGRLFEFGFGMAAAQNLFANKKLALGWSAGLVLLGGYFSSWTFPFTDALLGVGLFTLLWKIGEKMLSQFSKKFCSALAEQSYLMFLLHHPLIWLLERWLHFEPWSFTGLVLFLIFTAAVFAWAKLTAWILKRLVQIYKGFANKLTPVSAKIFANYKTD
jgi:peptidoglycan/LPS O-acetylase OafA/YrhL